MNNTKPKTVQERIDDFTRANTFDGKRNLARLLASENLTVEHRPDLSTAMFDVKRRVLSLPMFAGLSNDMHDMLIGHEVGHAIFTPTDEQVLNYAVFYVAKDNMEVAKWFLNIVEDARIERFMKNKFPGLIRNFHIGYRESYNMDLFGIKKVAAEGRADKITMIDRLNVVAKMGEFVPELGDPLTQQEQDFLDRMMKLTTFDEVVQLAKEIYDAQKPEIVPPPPSQQSQGQQQQQQGQGQGQGQGQKNQQGQQQSESNRGSSSNEGPQGSDYQAPTADNSQQQGQGQGQDQKNQQGQDQKNQQGQDQKNQQGQDQKNQQGQDQKNQQEQKDKQQNKKPDKPLTGDIHGRIGEKMRTNNDGHKVSYLSMPENWDINRHIVTWREVEKDYTDVRDQYVPMTDKFASWKREQRASITEMVKQFNLRQAADAHARTSTAMTGALDPKRLMFSQTHEDLFRRCEVVKQGKNHGLLMVIDWSGSMSGCIYDTVKQTLAMIMFCQQVKIPFAVYSFTDVHHKTGNIRSSVGFGSDADMALNSATLIEWLNSNMTTRQLYDAMVRMFTTGAAVRGAARNGTRIPSGYTLGGTPLCETVALLRYLIPKFQQDTKVQIMNTMILTDGEDMAGLYNKNRSNNFVYGSDSVLRDTKTKYQVAICREDKNPRRPLQRILELVRETTECNLIGFYLVGSSSVSRMIGALAYGYPNQNTATKELTEFYKKNGYADVKGTGYDSYFVVPCDKMGTDDEGSMTNFSKTKQSAGQVETSYINMLQSRKANKLFLGRLIDALARDHSKESIKAYRKGKHGK